MAPQLERRDITFHHFDEIVADAEHLASGKWRTTGRHSLGQILHHLALSHDVASGRVVAPPPPWFMKLLMPLISRMVINDKPLKPGVKLPAKSESFFWPNKEFDVPLELQHLKESVDYLKSNGALEIHPFFGKLTKEESEQLSFRHAALHLSFVHPA
jgi:hypothetical protein